MCAPCVVSNEEAARLVSPAAFQRKIWSQVFAHVTVDKADCISTNPVLILAEHSFASLHSLKGREKMNSEPWHTFFKVLHKSEKKKHLIFQSLLTIC